MKQTTLIIAVVSFLVPGSLHGAEASQTLEQDAAALAPFSKTTWKSGVLDIRYANGSTDKRRLVMVFEPMSTPNAKDGPQAKVRFLLESPPQGVPGVAEVGTSFGESSLREVRLKETGGVRTITMRKGPENVGGVPSQEQLERILNRSAISFTYQLKGDTLTLQGFPKGVTRWGALELTVPETEITFQVVK
jgi:hypothetical protein